MSESGKTFNLKGCTIGYVVPLSGFGEGSAIEIEPVGDSFVTVTGVDGSMAFSYTAEKAFKMMIKLLSTSLANAVLSAAYMADITALDLGKGGIVLPFVFKDNNGVDTFFSPKARIIKPPKIVRGSKVETQEWNLVGADGRIFLGGNP